MARLRGFGEYKEDGSSVSVSNCVYSNFCAGLNIFTSSRREKQTRSGDFCCGRNNGGVFEKGVNICATAQRTNFNSRI